MAGKKALTATDLAAHHHFHCDLYLHKTHHKSKPLRPGAGPSVIATAQFVRGNKWESDLFTWLDDHALLLTIPSRAMKSPTDLMENILHDERDHFFIAGLSFYPPMKQLEARFQQAGTNPVPFALAKPDLLEIKRIPGGVTWRVLDAKASGSVKTSHHVQIYFYTLCLTHLLSLSYFQSEGSAGIWLPPAEGFDASSPSLDDIKSVSISLLAPSMNDFLFRKLPLLLALEESKVPWHFNPSCRGCPYVSECSQRAVKDGELGMISNLSIEEARVLRDLIYTSRGSKHVAGSLSDIEELSSALSDRKKLDLISQTAPITLRKAKRILRLPLKQSTSQSPVIAAALSKKVQVIPKRNYSLPSEEDIAVIISVIQDPSSATLRVVSFCISIFATSSYSLPQVVHGTGTDLIASLANLIQQIIGITSHPRTQFFTFSASDYSALQNHIINAALNGFDHPDEIRICIGAISQGASVLQTTYQPLILSGALLDFLSNSKRTKAELQVCLRRMDLPIDGDVQTLRKRIHDRLQHFQALNSQNPGGEERRKELGQLSRVVVLQKQIEQLLALPIPGFWDLHECASVLLPNMPHGPCPTPEELYKAYCDGASTSALLISRNQYIELVLRQLRQRISSFGNTLLVNQARPLTAGFMDICREESLRKLFFMQQFEVLSKLSELWKSRIAGCPEAPILEYRSTSQGSHGIEHVFHLASGSLEVRDDKERSLYDHLLVEDEDELEEIPAEALFDDLGVSGLVFPLNKYTKPRWDAQHSRVRNQLCIADIRNMRTDGHRIQVTVQTWGSAANLAFSTGRRYRVSPRLVDFNISKVLSTLAELDFRCISSSSSRRTSIPFLQLITEPKSLGRDKQVDESSIQKKQGNRIQRLFKNLKNLDVDPASALVLKLSQNQAAQRIISNRLSVVWGPPGTGKTHTIAVSLLRLLEIQNAVDPDGRRILFLTAMTHAAIEAIMKKLTYLMQCYHSIESLPTGWLDSVTLTHVLKGNDEKAPPVVPGSFIYAGTVFQLYNFSKKHAFLVDCVVMDEAGQMSLSAAALVLRSVNGVNGKIVCAGDSEQLAPILASQYPQLKSGSLFGSVLDCLMWWSRRNEEGDVVPSSPVVSDSQGFSDSQWSQSTVVQLTENFRLNADLGDFVSTIYSRAFKAQKTQPRQLAATLKGISSDLGQDFALPTEVVELVQWFLLALSDAMSRQPQNIVQPPPLKRKPSSPKGDGGRQGLEISLAMIRLQTFSGQRTDSVAYEMHVKTEAAVAAALAVSLHRCAPQEDIFVATPHRIQRQAVREAVDRALDQIAEDELVRAFGQVDLDESSQESRRAQPPRLGQITVDTVERLQGSEAGFVICLFSLPQVSKAELGFLLQRRRLNVAVSRAKTLCLMITSSEVLRPSIHILADDDVAKGYGFLKGYEERAWSTTMTVDTDSLDI